MKATIYILLFVILAAAILFGITRAKLKAGTTVRVSESQINKSLAKKFPVEKTHLKIIHTRLDQPRVLLHEDQNSLQIEATAHVSSLIKPIEIGSLKIGTNKTSSATVLIEGGLSFEASEGTFYFTEAELISVDSEKKVPEKLREPLRKAVSLIAKETLNRLPVYTLKEGELKQDMAKMILRDVRIEDGRVALSIQLP